MVDPLKGRGWKDLRIEREKREETGLPGKILITVFFMLGGAALGAFLGYFIAVRMYSRTYLHGGQNNLLFIIPLGGAIVGALSALVFSVKTLFIGSD